MRKKQSVSINNDNEFMKHIIKTSEDLVTSKEQTRAGFIAFALEKNRRSTPIIENAKSLKILASKARTATDLLKIIEIRPALLTASGLSDKALNHFTEEDKNNAILGLIEKFLEPAGKYFVDEVVYRYLLIKGDSLGGSMRNIVGAIAHQKFVRTLLSNLSISGADYQWLNNKTKNWEKKPADDLAIEEQLKALSWINSKRKIRVLAFNLNIPIVKNNIDICLFNADIETYNNGAIVNAPEKILMLGELKGGIDPAGADEHWKTGNTALNRIRESFGQNGLKIETSFIAAAIEKKMATEIFVQLQNKTLSNAANLTIDEQIVSYCDWLLKL
ncbi:MAG: type II restriction endonuclease [Chitinispirillales bacterium]|jgi:type II restriction enzyme|nr:type II restriction endonuclease [Chitinispirillales bacterium]